MWQKYRRVRQDTDDNITRRMRIACWLPKATNTHSQYVILIAFPLKQWLQERAPISRYTYSGCPVVVHTLTTTFYCHWTSWHCSYTVAYDGVYDSCSVYRIYNIRCALYLHVYGIYSYVPTVALFMQLEVRFQLQIFRSQKLTQIDCRQADTAALFDVRGSTQLGAVSCALLFVTWMLRSGHRLRSMK